MANNVIERKIGRKAAWRAFLGVDWVRDYITSECLRRCHSGPSGLKRPEDFA